MKIQARHTLPCSAERFWQLYFDEQYGKALNTALDLARYDVLTHQRRGDIVVMRVSIAPRREMPAAVRKVFANATLAYDEHREIDVAGGVLRWRAEHPMLGDRFDCGGTLSIRARDDDHCLRVLDGDIVVKILGVGRLIEKTVAADVERTYDTSARFIERWVREHADG